jgi:glycosyltransferase involved in cell wall biosynthesis
VILIPKHYYGSYGGLQNFTRRLALGMISIGLHPIVISAIDNAGPANCDHYGQEIEGVLDIRLQTSSRISFWSEALSCILQTSPRSISIAVGLEQAPHATTQLRCLAEVAATGRSAILRVATSGDFESRIDRELAAMCSRLSGIVVLNSYMKAEVERIVDRNFEVSLIPVIGADAANEGIQRSLLRELLRSRYNIDSSTFIALWAGRPVPRKRLLKLLSIWRSADINGILLLAGVDSHSDSPYVKEVIDFVRVRGLENVKFMPPIPASSMVELYTIADCFLFTSSREGMSNAVVEAVCSGLPVLASDIPGVREISGLVSHTAFHLFSDSDDAGFVLKLRDVWSKRSVVDDRIVQQCRQRFSASTVAREYLDLVRRAQNRSIVASLVTPPILGESLT